MNRSFLTSEEQQVLFTLRLNRSEALRQVKEITSANNLHVCWFNIYNAELEIWKFFQRKISQVTTSDKFWEIFTVVRDIFGETYFTFELKVTFETLLRKFRDFISEQCARARQKLHSVFLWVPPPTKKKHPPLIFFFFFF